MTIAAICHDYGHDGFTNSYHINALSERLLRFNEKSVQESYHAAQSFSILNQAENNFISTLDRNDFVAFRMRFVGIILATDMAKHMDKLKQFNSLIAQFDVVSGKNAEKCVDSSSQIKKFNSQQFLYEVLVHSADVSA